MDASSKRAWAAPWRTVTSHLDAHVVPSVFQAPAWPPARGVLQILYDHVFLVLCCRVVALWARRFVGPAIDCSSFMHRQCFKPAVTQFHGLQVLSSGCRFQDGVVFQQPCVMGSDCTRYLLLMQEPDSKIPWCLLMGLFMCSVLGSGLQSSVSCITWPVAVLLSPQMAKSTLQTSNQGIL